jgi:hypothetical protein
MGKSDNSEISSRDNFWKKESKSHYIRKKELTEDDYVRTHHENLPLIESSKYSSLGKERLYTYQENCRLLTLNPMMNLSTMLNSDVRLKYGTGQLDTVESYENNYNQYIKNLLSWAKGLHELNLHLEAISVLKEAIAVGADVSHIYLLLGQVYADTGKIEDMKQLIDYVSQSNFMLKNKIIEGLTTLLTTMNTKN